MLALRATVMNLPASTGAALADIESNSVAKRHLRGCALDQGAFLELRLDANLRRTLDADLVGAWRANSPTRPHELIAGDAAAASCFSHCCSPLASLRTCRRRCDTRWSQSC